MHTSARRRIAVIGGGISGITAAHVLQRAHDVTLYEASEELGGHAHAIEVDDGRGGRIAVDTAFLVYNDLHYPRFVELLDTLGVRGDTQPAEMSTCFANYDQNVHYTLGRGAASLFEQRRTLRRASFARMAWDLVSFRRRAYRDLVEDRVDPQVTLGEYLKPYSSSFRDNFVVPLTVAIWSLPPGDVLGYPAHAILRFFFNHRLLRGASGDAWRTFRGSSARYVRAFRGKFGGRLALGRAGAVRTVIRDDRGAYVATDGEVARFDDVVMATHPDVALRLLAAPSAAERRLLGAWRYSPNAVTLHRDPSVMHEDRRLWASWNVVTRGGGMTVSYYLNRVQSLNVPVDYFVTLGDRLPLGAILHTKSFRHPVFDRASVATQPEIRRISGENRTHFCGAYLGHGFHEDGVVSALDVARHYGLALDRAADAQSPVGGEPLRYARPRSSAQPEL